jgi:hypothetical protein
VHGQQLLGHELAHVVQQRAGRVRNPLGIGLAVVHDKALEAEADRLGQRVAAPQVALQPKLEPVGPSAKIRAQSQQISPRTFHQMHRPVTDWVPNGSERQISGPGALPRRQWQSDRIIVQRVSVVRNGNTILVSGLLEKRVLNSPSSGTIQRKVGFEYEMTDINTRRRNFFGNGNRPHTKGYVLRSRPGTN